MFIDLGGKSEGCIAKNEFADDEGQITIKEGDSVQAYFLARQNQELVFTVKMSGGAARMHLEEAFHNGIPLEGTIDKEIKGGFSVRIAGNVRAFCPYSQLEIHRIDGAEQYIGKQFSFKITEYSNQGRNIVLSRRRILEEEREEKKNVLRESLKEGDAVRGRVKSIHDFGAFLDIDGIEGLIPISEIGWGVVEDAHEYLSEGQEVDAVVLKLNWEKNRFSFSLKQAMPDPWDTVQERFPEGTSHSGTVVRLLNAGVLVRLAKGIDGFVHISKLGKGRRINHPREVIGKGDEVEVLVESLDIENRRMSLSIPAFAAEAAKVSEKKSIEKPKEESREDYKQFLDRRAKSGGEPLGTLGDLLKGKLDKK